MKNNLHFILFIFTKCRIFAEPFQYGKNGAKIVKIVEKQSEN
jgi:hypothetical protein